MSQADCQPFVNPILIDSKSVKIRQSNESRAVHFQIFDWATAPTFDHLKMRQRNN
jgi:hypothetical protein